MVGAMHHRGPDDRGTLFDDRVALGMTRLAIIDTSSGGHQPMRTPDGLISVVYNGELYNFREERRLLEAKGYEFGSASDTEVVLRMYEHYADDFLLRLRGMFALAVYDKRRGPGRERLLLARDHMGIKPLLYARAGDRLIFASEMKALLASGLVEARVDPRVIGAYAVDDHVVPAVHRLERVIAREALGLVVSAPEVEGVVARAAGELVAAVAAEDSVVAAVAVEGVHGRAGVGLRGVGGDQVVAGAGGDLLDVGAHVVVLLGHAVAVGVEAVVGLAVERHDLIGGRRAAEAVAAVAAEIDVVAAL
jgi:hypothetical protein